MDIVNSLPFDNKTINHYKSVMESFDLLSEYTTLL